MKTCECCGEEFTEDNETQRFCQECEDDEFRLDEIVNNRPDEDSGE